jgi:enoyl-CoA hydratase/carnithine racemase
MKAQSPAQTRSAAAAPVLLRETIGSIAVLTLNRPQARNSLSEAMLAALSQELESLAKDEGIRAVVLAAKGQAFCAGHDLKELTSHRADADGGRGYTRQVMQRCSAMMLALLGLPQPVIAAVEATATAAGCQLVATCDLAVASTTAKFATPGVHIGLFCSTPMVALSRNVPRKQAMEMLLTGDMISAEDAYRIGLVNRVVESGKAREGALELAREITAKSRSETRQRGILSAARHEYCGRIRLRERGHGEKHDGPRRRRRHFSFRRKAAAEVGGSVTPRNNWHPSAINSARLSWR